MSETRSLGDLRLHPRVGVVPFMPPEEQDQLLADIERRGIVVPLDILPDGTVLDGRTRYSVAQAIGLAEVPVRVVEPEDPFVYMLLAAIERRHLTPSQKAMLALALDEYQRERAAARERKAQAPGQPRGVKASLPATLPEERTSQERAAAESRNRAGKVAGVSGRLVQDALKVTQASPELAEQVRSGKLTVTAAARQIQRAEERRRAAATPPVHEHVAGQRYRTIVIDPPWDPSDEGDADQMGRAQPLYATMPIEQVRAMPIAELAEPDGCHLYLWITNRSLPKGFGLLEAWGFRHVTMLTWIKPSIGVGNYFRNSTEHVLFGVRGSLALLEQDQGTWFEAPRGGRHSAKPDAFYAIAKRCSPGPRLDIFGRGEREGFAVWGSEMAA